MSVVERIAWALSCCGPAVTLIGWWRDEREIRAIQVAHETEMARITAHDQTPPELET